MGVSSHPGGCRFGRSGGWQQAQAPDTTDAAEWFAGRLPDDWFTGPVVVKVDREEIVVVGELLPPEDASPAAVDGRISRFREATRTQRMWIADEAEARCGRKVAWGVTDGDHRQLFTHLAVPVMTRLRQPERQVLDTLVDPAWRARGQMPSPGRSGWRASTPRCGSGNCVRRCARSTPCAPRAQL